MQAGIEQVTETHSEKIQRAATSVGGSSSAVHRMAAEIVKRRGKRGTLLDIGCGQGGLRNAVQAYVDEYIGADLVKYEQYPTDLAFHQIDLDTETWGLQPGNADIVTAVETIEHLENPRAFVRTLISLCKPGGLIIITTPNQLSIRSKISLLLSNQYVAFKAGPGLYPTHITALLEQDLVRIASECYLTDIEVDWSHHGQIPKTQWHWPAKLGLRGRKFSDNFAVSGFRPLSHSSS